MGRYQLMIRVENLPKHRTIRNIVEQQNYKCLPNSYAIVKVTGGELQHTILGRTEIVSQSRSPGYCTIIFIETDFANYTPIQIQIYYSYHSKFTSVVNNNFHYEVPDDTDYLYYPDDKYIACANYNLSGLYNAPGHTIMQTDINNTSIKIYVSLEDSIKVGSYTIETFNNYHPKDLFELQIRGLELKNIEPGLFGLDRSDPYYIISRKNYDHAAGIVQWNPIYRSYSIENHLNPYWDPMTPTRTLEEICFNDITWPLLITVYSQYKGMNAPIGQVETTVADLINHIAIRGNADRDKALRLHKVSDQPDLDKIRGYIVVLVAKITRVHHPTSSDNHSNANTQSSGLPSFQNNILDAAIHTFSGDNNNNNDNNNLGNDQHYEAYVPTPPTKAFSSSALSI